MKQLFSALLLSGLVTLLSAQTITTITTPASQIDDDIIFDAAGNLYGSNYIGSRVYKMTPDGVETVFLSGLGNPNGMAFNDDGTFVLADNTGNKIYKVFPDGTITILVNSVPGPSGLLRMENSDTIIVTGYPGQEIWKMAPDGSMSSFLSHPEFKGPVGLSYDDNHNLYIANFSDRKIFKVAPGGQPQFLAQPPLGVNIGFLAYRKGYLYATAFQAHKIYKIDLDGNYDVWLGSTVGITDGDAAVAKFNRPNGIRFSTTGDTLYISDFGSKRVRMITNLDAVSALDDHFFTDLKLQIAPNPAVETTRISFELPAATAISLGFYNASGQLVQMIQPETHLSAGGHEYQVDCGNLPGGVYWLRMQTPSEDLAGRKIVVN